MNKLKYEQKQSRTTHTHLVLGVQRTIVPEIYIDDIDICTQVSDFSMCGCKLKAMLAFVPCRAHYPVHHPVHWRSSRAAKQGAYGCLAIPYRCNGRHQTSLIISINEQSAIWACVMWLVYVLQHKRWLETAWLSCAIMNRIDDLIWHYKIHVEGWCWNAWI